MVSIRPDLARDMKTGVLAILLLPLVALLAGVGSGLSHAADANRILDDWCAGQTNIHTWSADLTQTRSLRVLSQPLVAQGRVWVALPNRFRWELGQPAQTIAVRRPDELLLIYPRFKRAEKYPLGSAQPGPWQDALALLDASFPRSRTQLESRFRVASITHTNSTVSLLLEPKSAAARRIILGIQVSFQTNNYTPAATELRMSDGSTMRTVFTNSVVNAPLNPELFTATLPPGYTLITPLGP